MNTLDAIAARRSIRRFKADPIPDHILQTILQAGIHAPSGKNKQPWRFIVVKDDKRAEMVRILRQGIASRKGEGIDLGSSAGSANIMERAPVTVFVINPYGVSPRQGRSLIQSLMDVVDVQSVGAAIENMLLAAQDLGLGSLWICDVYYAYGELLDWLDEDGQLIAAVSFGYADERPDARPRKPVSDVVRFL